MTVRIEKPAINVREELADLRKPTGVAGEAMLRAETPQEQFNLIGAGRRNILINGGMTVWQRASSATAATNSDYTTADRWETYVSGGGAYTTERSTGHLADTGHDTALKITVTTADTPLASGDYYSFLQKVEAQNLQQLCYGTASAKHMNVSFWVRATKAGPQSFFITKNDSTEYHFVHEFNINASDTWEYKTITVPPLTASAGSIANDNGLGVQVGWILGYGSAYHASTTDAWVQSTTQFATATSVNNMDTVGNTFYLTGVQLELGKVATPFEHRSYGEELALCQRFFCIPVNNVDEDGNSSTISAIGVGRGAAGGATVVYALHSPVPMRDRPEITSSGSYYITDGTSRTAATPSAVTVSQFSPNSTIMLANYSFSSAVCDDDRVNMVGGATAVKITLDAEL
jgi:hypothetical protein